MPLQRSGTRPAYRWRRQVRNARHDGPLIAAVALIAHCWLSCVLPPCSLFSALKSPLLLPVARVLDTRTDRISPGRQVSPTAPSFGSNNPFRNRALSPSNTSTTSARPERPRSTNPFLDETDALSPQSAPGLSTGATMFSPAEKPDMTSNTRDLFVRTLNVAVGIS